MGLRLASSLAMTALFALIYAIVFTIVFASGVDGILGLILIIFLTLGIIFLQYALGPVLISWIYRIDWIPFEQYKHEFPHLAQVVEKVCKEKGIKIPKLGVIHDMNPNAFTYGWTKNSARVVVTEGILRYLNKKEQKAVVGHEMGHVIHNDFILMTVVFAIPLILYTIARWCYWSARYSGRSSDSESGNYITLALYAIGVLSYISYWIGYLISLFISRIREYYADEYSAEVLEDPNALSTSLVKIAYGLLENGATAENRKSNVRGLRGLGIMDATKASEFAYTTMDQNHTPSNDAVVAAAAWDLENPWARYFQLFSTHPLPAKRILRLNSLCSEFKLKPEIDLSGTKKVREEQAGKSMLPEFITDIVIKVGPWIIFFMLLFMTVGVIIAAAFGPIIFAELLTLENLILFWAIGFFIIGLTVVARTSFMFGRHYQPYKVRTLVSQIKASPIRSYPAVIEGMIVGRGTPGIWWGEDLYFQDSTGLMYVDYRSGLPIIGDFIFAIRKEKFVGRRARITGWYHRGPSPYIIVKKIEVEGAKRVYKSVYRAMTYIWAVLAFIISIGLFFFWFALITGAF
ncbi:MAG: zinc metalloprotease HtpX [Promethearchaeota archaeon]